MHHSLPVDDRQPGPAPLPRVLAPVLAVVLPVALRALLRADLDIYDTRDERLFHHPTIQGFADALPRPDLSDYPSATGPLYHLLLAPLAALSDDSLLLLRLATLALALVVLIAGGALLARRTMAPWWGLSLLLFPVGLSPYFLGPAVRLSTDDAALAFVVLSLLALDHARTRAWALRPVLLAALAAAAAVLTRQVHGWLVGVLALAPLLSITTPWGPRLRAAGLAALPVLAFAPLVVLWGGPTPPSFSEHDAGLNVEVLQTELAVLGALALPVAPWLLRALGRRGLALALFGGVLAAGLLLGLRPLPWVEDPLRYGGSLWRICQRFPDLAGSTLPFWGLLPLGVAATAAIAVADWRRRDPLPTLAICCFVVANIASARAYQKYYEPFLLMVLGWVVARADRAPRWWWGGPALLALAWAAVAVGRFVV